MQNLSGTQWFIRSDGFLFSTAVLDGTDPDQDSVLYNAPFTVGATATVKAWAYKPGYNPSGVATAVYQIDASPPLISSPSWDGSALSGGEELARAGALATTATDNQGVARAEFSYQPADNPARIAIGTDRSPGNGLSVPWDVALVSDGSYTLWARGHDNAGSFSDLSREVTVAFAPPPSPVSANGAPWERWIERTRETAAVYKGVPGETYASYSIACDAPRPGMPRATSSSRSRRSRNGLPLLENPLALTRRFYPPQ